MAKDYLELLELQRIIREGVEDAVPDTVRVHAEVASVQRKSGGHCYLELCQSVAGSPAAKIRAIIWRSLADRLLSGFASAAGEPLKAGAALVFEVRVNYSELYGISLIIEDIDISHTLGEAELQRRRTIERLGNEGLLDMQKELALPAVPHRLAVISAPDAAGYGDFRRHLLENEYGFAFGVQLFEAAMQGESAPSSICGALARIAIAEHDFDAVLILRGGGSVLDLACFDDYTLAAEIARFPLPVYTAIGHDRDVHAADLVACASVKTPTALADLFIDAVASEDECISGLRNRLRLAFASKIAVCEAEVARLEARIAASNPRTLLSRGYSLVTDSAGTLLRRASDASVGSRINILYPDGTLNCTIDEKV